MTGNRARFLKLWVMAAVTCGTWMSLGNLQAETPDKSNRWQSDIERFEKRDQQSPPAPGGVLFIGSSTIGMWDLPKHFPNMPVTNRGFGGSHISDSVQFAPRIVIPYRPRVIVFAAGGNDLNSGKKPDEVAGDFKKFVEVVQSGLPTTKIVFLAIKPTVQRWKQDPQTREVNQLIKDYMQGKESLVYLDSYTPFLGEDGKPREDLLIKDGLHLNEKGYELLTKIVMPAIKE